MTAKEVSKQLSLFADPGKAIFLQRFFKTGPGEYAEGDRFLGVTVPNQRKIARQFKVLPFPEALKLLKSKWHEERLTALFILVNQFEKGSLAEQKQIYDLYLKHTAHINNWDLVDSSAHQIVGGWLLERSRKPLYKLARSKSLWERRISIIATYHFIKQEDFKDTLAISEILLKDDEDLIHKAVGWMLREVGNRDHPLEVSFLKRHSHEMPRTMLRYAIEKFPEKLRKEFLTGTFQPGE
jgi:3-methyladenine DNA glycosylase AlkD